MKLKDVLFVNVKKLKTKTNKALFLIIPIFVLITLSVVLSSQIENVQKAISQSIFGTIAEKYSLIQVNSQTANSGQNFDPSKMFNSTSSVEENRFSNLDLEVINGLNHVESVSLQYVLPVSNVQTTDLFDGKTVKFNTLSTLDSSTSALYTTKAFSYTEGDAIPIILNSSALVYSYEDWGNSTSITMDSTNIQRNEGGTPTQRLSFLKTESIDYDETTLLGKEFTLEIGDLDTIQDYAMNRSSGTMTINKLTDEELAAKITARKEAISQYWNYDAISTPLKYTFVVVGIIDGGDNGSMAYIPENFANKLMTDYVSHEVNARTGSEISTDALNSTFTGITYDGVELKTSGNGMVRQMMRRVEDTNKTSNGNTNAPVMGQEPEEFKSFNTTGYLIPGLIIEVDNDNNVVGAVSDVNVYTNSTKYADTINVVIDSAVNRTVVAKELNDAGFAYQDSDEMNVFDKLEDTLSTVSKIFMISFIVLVGVTVAFTMSKFISESIKEIGIFRAIGMRKGDIVGMFISQSLLYVLIGYVSGLLLGIGLNFLAGYFVSGWFANFLTETIAKTFNVVNSVDGKMFFSINYQAVGIYTALLVGISSIISVITSLSASRVSPVEAIKNE